MNTPSPRLTRRRAGLQPEPSHPKLFSALLASIVCCLAMAAAATVRASSTDEPRREWSLADGWRTTMDERDPTKFDGFERENFDDSDWRNVAVPHNWETYEGARRLVHGSLHGFAWYRRTFELPAGESGRRVFLFFEGVGSYATVWVNGRLAGQHAGGRTTFTLDVTALARPGARNVVALRTDHPAGIADLPWVCGGCSNAPGFSEGSQPLGIFRPVTLYTTDDVRVEPFGIHVWNDADASARGARVSVGAEVRAYSGTRSVALVHTLLDPDGRSVATRTSPTRAVDGLAQFSEEFDLSAAQLWSPATPVLYRLVTEVRDGERLLDRVETPFGIRTIRWPSPEASLPAPFRVNGEPVFINGTCEYEHNLGGSHAFGAEQIRARVRQMQAAGFNAFRDAHQPHNLRYQDYWDRDGLLWWTQFAAQVWFDTPEFRANFKKLLRAWVRERRNSPSLVLWGLANESKLPEDFAAECVEIIRELDPTTPSQRLVTTCNAGKGTDWNVPQNWTGTYGGDPATYANDLRRHRLVGEYGAWRSLGLHSEGGFVSEGIRSESRHDGLMAMKIRLAESVRTEVPGHFHWLFVTHENPGRTIGTRGQQGSDGWAELDRIGPANNKGLLTLWGEPTDAFHLFRASYAPKTDPTVYIVSHTWPDRWDGPGRKDGIEVWSNCDEVELFNGVGRRSLGVRRPGGPGVPFRWDGVEVNFNVLSAEGRIAGKTVARDVVVLRNLPNAPERRELNGPPTVFVSGARDWNYLYRVNCGGPDYVDSHGETWFADRDLRREDTWGSHSWAAAYPALPARFGSQRETFDPIRGTADEALFQTYRYGRDQLRYEFAVPDGDYRVELYFTEPWYGRGGGDATGWRLFDVAINGETKLHNLDLWRDAGYAAAVKKVVAATARDGRLTISFPRIASYQAVVSAIAIASRDASARPPVPQQRTVAAAPATKLAEADAESSARQLLPASAAKRTGAALSWTVSLGLGGSHDFALRYANPGEPVPIEFRVNAADGTPIDLRVVRFVRTAPDGASVVRVEGIGMNAGDYQVTLTLTGATALSIETLIVD